MSINKSIVQITTWQTEDGKRFNTEFEAQWHQDKCDLLKYLSREGVYWREPNVDDLLTLIVSWARETYTQDEK